MNNSPKRKFLLGMHDFSCKEQNKADKLPKIIFANAIGDPEAVAIVAEWRPKFSCTVVNTLPEHVGWD
jgi:hypothetical protein